MPGFIPWSQVDLPLRAYRSIWMSTTRPDGRPHAVPVWYVWDSTSIYFITRRDMQKAKNLAHQPWIVVHAGDGDDVILLEGPVATRTDWPTKQERLLPGGRRWSKRTGRTASRSSTF
jgi:nitroimidazol reductase NimA-like FMN-containing flavoprotein (pyridoxamine 5'-phosphate oxidase superfamily)